MLECPNCQVPLEERKNIVTGKTMFICPLCDFIGGKNFNKLNEMFAFVSVDQDGNEGVITMRGPNNMALPMVTSESSLVDKLKPKAKEIEKSIKMKVKLLKFTTRTEIEF
jgi:uncharacterized Zn finger protein (UPF0148 family)